MTEQPAPSPFQRVEFPPIPASLLDGSGFEDVIALALNARPVLPVEKVTAYVGLPRELLGDDYVTVNFIPPTPEERAAAEQCRAAWRADRERRHAEAVAEWAALREQHAGSPALLAVLDIHQPTEGLECAHPVYGYEADDEDWPCSTYEAIRGAS